MFHILTILGLSTIRTYLLCLVLFFPVTLITNLVRGKDLHHMIFGTAEALDVGLFSIITIPHVCSHFFNADDICS